MEKILKNINLIHKYLCISIADEFNLILDLRGEYVPTQNIVSKKMIIATTFSIKVVSDPQLKLFLSAMISEINNGKCSIDFMKERIKNFEKQGRQEFKKLFRK